jgi:hypothetical protein
VSGEQPPPPGGGEPPAPPPGWSQSPAPTPGWGRPAPRPGSEPGPDEETPRWLQSHGSPAPYVSPYPVGAPGPPGWQPTGLPGAAHRPGAIPLRPLVLGDILDGAFRIIRYNPRATVGAAVLVSAVAMVLPVVVGIITGSSDGLRFEPGSDGLSDGQVAGLVTTFGSLLLAYQLQAIGLLFVSGMIAHVTSAAAVGRRLTLGEAWGATAGKRWRLFGMSLLLGLGVIVVTSVAVGIVVLLALTSSTGVAILFGILIGVMLVVGYIAYWVRLRALAVPILMLEPVGVLAALGRAVRLTRHQFWRIFGILLLVSLIIGFAGSMLRLPFSISGQVFLTGNNDSGSGLVVYLLLTAAGTIVSSALVQPFQAAVNSLLYVDQRMRKEAYDVELLGRAGIR